MAEEVKKAKKPRASKKSAQGESVPQEAVEMAAVAEETAVKKAAVAEETAVEKAAVAEETKKKAPAKRTRKKAVEAQPEVVKEVAVEMEKAPAAALL